MFTKSKFTTAVNCPRKLAYTDNSSFKNCNAEDSFLKSLAASGFQVGTLAKQVYPEGVDLEALLPQSALARTTELLIDDAVTIFEPAFSYGRFLIRCDILIKNGNAFEIIEVKAKSYDSANPQSLGANGKPSSRYLPYLQDIAFQTHVLRLCFPDADIRSSLMMPDKTRAATIDQMNQLFPLDDAGERVTFRNGSVGIGFEQSLLSKVSVDQYVYTILSEPIQYPGGKGLLADVAEEWAQAYAKGELIKAPIGSHCASCEFVADRGSSLRSGFHECWQEANGWSEEDFPDATVLDLWNFRQKDKLIQQGKRDLKSVTQDDIGYAPLKDKLSQSERQWLQINGLASPHKERGFFFDDDYMSRQMAGWRYPLHFIDFETSAPALPFHIGMKPFENVAFQYSHHILERDGSLRHASEFLMARAGMFPNFEFVRALKNALDNDDGTVFCWASHENTILENIKQQLKSRKDTPDDKGELVAFLDHLTKGGDRQMVDLKKIAEEGFFHPASKGSNSIKKVLPAVLSSSAYLQKRYSQPIYGASNGIASRNYNGIAWWQTDQDGKPRDPYKILRNISVHATELGGIAEGGEAAMAYAKLQNTNLCDAQRQAIEASLKRYCELDTLAMAMITEAWTNHFAKR
jgi:hypothetical protein